MADTWDMTERSTHKKTDSKGRLTLGEAFANCTLIVEQRGSEIVLQRARVIPESEAWLYENQKALASVRRGLKQANAGEFSDGPDLDKAAKLSDQLDAE
jgi:hypothetical protein